MQEEVVVAAIDPKPATLRPPLRQTLAVAVAGLLSHSATAAEDGFNNDWRFDMAYLRYQETNRIEVDSYIIDVRGNLSDDDNIKLGVVLDTMTGSTPTGAVKNSGIVTVTGTSGSGGFTAGGDAAAIAPFSVTRLAIDFNWQHLFSSAFRMNYGTYLSVESDYNSIGAHSTAQWDTASKAWTWELGGGFARDISSQTGGQTPEPLAKVDDARFFAPGKRYTYDIFAGLTHVLNRRTLAQFNVSYSLSQGYLNDPYKVLSRANDDDIELERLYEDRPGSRSRYAVFTQLKHELNSGNNISLSYRYYWDDWAIQAHTVETHYRFNRESGAYWEPFTRLYYQTAADFYVRTLGIDEELPKHASADNRLAEMTAVSAGLKFSLPVWDYGDLRTRVFYYKQSIENAVYADNDAFVLTVNFAKSFQ